MRMLKAMGKGVVEAIDAPEPLPESGEVLIETGVSLLCGSELSAYRGAGVAGGNLGHEAAGTILKLGPAVTGLIVGQRVGASAISGCGECVHCKQRRFTWCSKFKFHSNMHAQRFVVAAMACNPLPDDVAFDTGALLSGDGLGVPYHTSLKIASPEIKTIAIFGAGPIGLGGALLQAHLGRRVMVVDVSPYRLELAKKLGADAVVNAKETDAVAKIRDLTDGVGPDVCIEAAGRPETALQCFSAVKTGGIVVFNGEQGALQLSPSDHFMRRDITAVGSWYYHFSECGEMLELYRRGLQVNTLLTHRYPYEEAATAFENFAAGQAGKVVLQY